MRKVKAGLRLLVVVLLLILAAFGIGITGSVFNNKERYMDNEIKTEKADKKNEGKSKNYVDDISTKQMSARINC